MRTADLTRSPCLTTGEVHMKCTTLCREPSLVLCRAIDAINEYTPVEAEAALAEIEARKESVRLKAAEEAAALAAVERIAIQQRVSRAETDVVLVAEDGDLVASVPVEAFSSGDSATHPGSDVREALRDSCVVGIVRFRLLLRDQSCAMVTMHFFTEHKRFTAAGQPSAVEIADEIIAGLVKMGFRSARLA